MKLLQALGIRKALIGVDIGAAAVTVVQLSFGRKGVKLKYAGLTELAPAADGAQDGSALIALQDLLRQGRLSRNGLAMNYSVRPPIIRHLTMPHMPKDELTEAVRWEAKKLVPFPAEEMLLDYLIVGDLEERGTKRHEIVLVAAEKIAVRSQLESLGPQRSRVAAVDVNPLALLNTIRLNYKADLDKNLAYIDIGASKMDISIAKGGALRFTRHVELAGAEITRAIMRELNVEAAEAEQLKRQNGLSSDSEDETLKKARSAVKDAVDRIVLEVQRSIDYYRAQFRESEVRKIVLMGGTPLLPGFQEYFAGYFDATVELDDPFAEVICDDPAFADLRLMAPRFSSGVGLALRETA